MTRSYILFMAILDVLKRYQECRIDINEAALQVVESYAWTFGPIVDIERLVFKFPRRDIQIFLALCAKNS